MGCAFAINTDFAYSAVPIPNTFWLFAGGLLLFFLTYDWRQRRQAGMQVG